MTVENGNGSNGSKERQGYAWSYSSKVQVEQLDPDTQLLHMPDGSVLHRSTPMTERRRILREQKAETDALPSLAWESSV